jgi:hypothetical protein
LRPVLSTATYLVRRSARKQFNLDSVPLAQLKPAVAAIAAVPWLVHDEPESA